jgi:nucleotide-binding universal stress UspA family protein
MYKKVLAAVNEHLNSEVSARYALQFAKKANAGIFFCSIAEKGLSGKAFQAAEEAIRRLSLRAEELGVKADSVLETGEPFKQIRKIVTTEGIDIVFASTRREDVKKRFYTHTTARQLSLGLPCSVALVRVVHLGRVHPKTILVPLRARLDHIAERAYFTTLMARSFDAGVFLFHAAKPMMRFFHGEIHLTPVEWEAKLPNDIALFIDYLNRYDVAHEKTLIPGIAGRSIAIKPPLKARSHHHGRKRAESLEFAAPGKPGRTGAPGYAVQPDHPETETIKDLTTETQRQTRRKLK